MTVAERVRSKVERRHPLACWPWLGGRTSAGYGVVRVGSRLLGTRTLVYAHRLVYELECGDVASGHEVHHRCVNPSCVNPAHLVALDPIEHPDKITSINARKTHCIHGHPLSGANLYVRPNGWRSCRTCLRANARRYTRRRRVAA